MSSRNDGNGAHRGSTGSIEGDLILRKLEGNAQRPAAKAPPSPGGPVAQAARASGAAPSAAPQRHEIKLPTVKAPSLDNLQVTVPQDSDITQEELLMRFHELVRAHSATRERAPGEPVQLGDTVVLDTLGYAQGRLIPFSARSGFEMEMAPSDLLPGLPEGLVGTPVGGGQEVQVTLPDTYPVEHLRGVHATFLVDVVAAREVTVPDAESDAFVRKLGRGMTLEAVMESLADEIANERADDMWLEAQERVLDELVLRTEVPLTVEMVDEEIRQAWSATEARMLARKDFAPDELQESLDGWLDDPTTRLEAERRLRIAFALRAIVERDKLQLTPEKMDEVLEEAVVPFGLSLEEARRALANPATAEGVRNAALQVVAVRHVMGKAQVRFEGVPGVFSGTGKQLR
ncbi:Cell division trigger factor [Archangium gephyra]|uniref:Cell division trigger factor n=1 Tax=Archangium gephyra TaxID=48 RepID=A0AAC8QBA4_9BACT|nr:Cell division trigger factor [Archangium gephyra]